MNETHQYTAMIHGVGGHYLHAASVAGSFFALIYMQYEKGQLSTTGCLAYPRELDGDQRVDPVRSHR